MVLAHLKFLRSLCLIYQRKFRQFFLLVLIPPTPFVGNGLKPFPTKGGGVQFLKGIPSNFSSSFPSSSVLAVVTMTMFIPFTLSILS